MPPVGLDFAGLNSDRYVNINTIYPQSDRLHGTETLFGDWSGKVLILGQDFDCARKIQTRARDNGGKNPFHHARKFETNKNLVKFLSPFFDIDIDGTNNRGCGLMYGNAVWLLKDVKSSSSPLPCLTRALKTNALVLRATLEAMPNLKCVLCLGAVAYKACAMLSNFDDYDWRRDLEARRSRLVDGILFCPLSHTGELGINNRIKGRGVSREIKRKMVEEDFRIYLEAVF